MSFLQTKFNTECAQTKNELVQVKKPYKPLTGMQRAITIKSLTELSNIHNYVLKHPGCSHKDIISFADTSKYQTERYSKIINHHPEQLKIKLDELEWLLKNPS